MQKKLTYIDLFSGAGGFSLGFDNAGLKNIFALDANVDFGKTYTKNFPEHHLIQKKIEEFSNEEIKEILKGQKIDIIIGGPPCQGFSIAGNIGRQFIDDPRNHLFKEFARIVELVKPRFFVMENVARLYNHNKGKTRKEILETFEKMGYTVDCKILNSADYGVAQVRKRVIFIGSLENKSIIFPEKEVEEYITVKEVLEQYPALLSGEEASEIPNHKAMKHSAQMLEKMSYIADGGDRNQIPLDFRPKTGDARKYIKYKSDSPAVCVTGDMRKIFHYEQNRALTVRELAELQSFPADFEFLGTSISQQQQVGNAVPPKMAEAIAKTILKLKETTYKYPKVNYIGNKEQIASWICDKFPEDAKTVFDAFSGGGSLAFEAKKRGYEVYTNDILQVNFQLAKGLIENKNIRLDEKDIEMIFSGESFEGFMFENYANVFFFPEECKELDLYRENINKLDSEYKQALALALMRRAMIRKMPYSRFNLNWEKIKQLRDEEYSYQKYKRKRAYHNQSFQFHFLENLDEYNEAVFDNGQNHKAYNSDIFNILEHIEADIIYLDPPYTGTMNDYFGFYALLDNYILSEKKTKFENSFTNKKTVGKLFNQLFSKLSNFKYGYLSYNNSSYPSKEQLLSILELYAREIEVIEKEHIYKVTGKEKKQQNKEYLLSKISKSNTMTVQNYEEYWKLTLAFTNYNGDKFRNTLKICVDFIDTFQHSPYTPEKYTNLQLEIQQSLGIQDVSVRKAINQLVKLGFINSFLVSYHNLAKDYLKARSNKKRQILLSKIVYSNASFNRAVNNASNIKQLNFLIQTLVEKGKLSKEEIIALMLVDIEACKTSFLPDTELAKYVSLAQKIGFIDRKYNQVSYLTNLLAKLEDLVFVGQDLYFREDAEQIFGSDLKKDSKKRDPYLHRLYKNQLKEESESFYGRTLCMLEKLEYLVLIASHIKPFIDSDENEAYDADNGLLLSRTIDSLFDLKYISFTDKGKMIFSKRLSKDVKQYWKNYKIEPDLLNDKRKKYLAYHRKLMQEVDSRK